MTHDHDTDHGPETADERTWRNPRDYITAEYFDRTVQRIVKHTTNPREKAERMVEQAVAFVVLCAEDAEGGYCPSLAVDYAWHTMILDTRDYTDMCVAINGDYVHHVPTDPKTVKDKNPQVFRDTVADMAKIGFHVDHELWHGYGSCQCCTAAPPCSNVRPAG